MVKNIILVGFMATGKTTVGKLLAHRLGWAFLDTDQEIERTTGLSIPEIFKRYGEESFRKEETRLVRQITKMKSTVISTGGGLVLPSDHWKLLEEVGIMVHLWADPDVIIARAGQNEERPLLQQDPEQVRALLDSRMPVYNQAAISIETTGKNPSDIVNEVANMLEKKKNM
ncbi:Shikimate kinase [Syntrophobotulus glycolicus DSM 8271]|uniref:Shikimate kinase n=1 Tax=Syntrophobotulus glycolicus (strain DSM 8271 / FlGlyR) TaxID=645991 RepID=F0T0T9_SYNGF|nr:shikimate kinase [Syntrophobotulus glycolicus]ADY56228.1 Shikimate kinase [Syntrophobotulus glycolicus DSM 8271]